MRITIDVVQSDDGLFRVDTDYPLGGMEDDGRRVIKSLELAMCDLLRDIAIGLVREDLRHLYDHPVNLLEELEEAHRDVIRRMKSGEFGSGTIEDIGGRNEKQ